MPFPFKECWTKELKSSLSFFQEEVSSLAVDVNQGELVRARLNRSKKKRGRHYFSAKQDDTPATQSKKANATKDFNFSNKKPTKPTGKVKDWPLPCIYRACPEKHPFKECTNTPDSERQALWDAWKEKRKNSKTKNMSLTKFNGKLTLPNSEEGGYCVLLENEVSSTALGDTERPLTGLVLKPSSSLSNYSS